MKARGCPPWVGLGAGVLCVPFNSGGFGKISLPMTLWLSCETNPDDELPSVVSGKPTILRFSCPDRFLRSSVSDVKAVSIWMLNLIYS